MPDERRFPPDIAFNEWHRPASIGRYVSSDIARKLVCVDIDLVEVCHGCSQPLAFIETTRNTGRHKPTTVTRNVARMCGRPAYLVAYDVRDDGDVRGARVSRIWPPTNVPTQYWEAHRLAHWVAGLHYKCRNCGISAVTDEHLTP